MKISKLFHWLYASVMFLPLVIIPLFGIWTINHDHNEPISITLSRNEIVDYNQLLEPNAIYSDDYYFDLTTENTANVNYQTGYTSIPIINSHKYYFRMTDIDIQNASGYFLFGINYDGSNRYKQVYSSGIYIFDYTGDYNLSRVLSSTTDTTLRYLRCYLGLFDLTQMFGIGNEPTSQEFETYFTDDYYIYSTGQLLTIKVDDITYSDTDIGSQFLYTLYNSTDKYLNFDNVLNLGAISEWLEINVFNGNAPLVFYIVWHYLDYWLILSIFWLCFDVLIYVPNIAHRWLDRATLE